jgi:hypothetical protein
MVGTRQIASARLSGRDKDFRLSVMSWEDAEPPEDHLLVEIEISTSEGAWRSRATSVLAPGLRRVADAANRGLHDQASGEIGYAQDEGGRALAFSFTLLPEDGRIDVSVVIDEGLEPDVPVYPDSRSDTVLLRVSPEKVIAFADALEGIARRDPTHVAWSG